METKSILLISSDLEVQTVLESRLANRGYVIHTVDSIERSFKEVEREIPDLILLDAEVEKVSEADLVSKMKSVTLSLCIPVVLLAQADRISSLILGVEKGFDDFLTKPIDSLELTLRVALNIKRMEERGQYNPLTKLPGNIAIERVLKERIKQEKPFSVCYIDINQFKSFNDCYDYSKGDDVIKQTARIIVNAVRQLDPAGGAFVGHVGGDDFVVVLDPQIEETFASACIREFDRLIPTHYSPEDRQRGCVQVENRRGRMERFSLMSLSVAAVTNLNRKFHSTGQIARAAAEVKKFLKTQHDGSHYLRDRRNEPIEQVEQAQEVLARSVSPKTSPAVSREPLGQLLVTAGLISQEELAEALKKHLETGQRLGQVLISMRLVSSADVGRMLEKKLKIPYVSLRKTWVSSEVAHLFTTDFIQSHRAAPLRKEGVVLVVGMVDPYDVKAVDEIEQTAKMKVKPCLVLEDEFETFLEERVKEGVG